MHTRSGQTTTKKAKTKEVIYLCDRKHVDKLNSLPFTADGNLRIDSRSWAAAVVVWYLEYGTCFNNVVISDELRWNEDDIRVEKLMVSGNPMTPKQKASFLSVVDKKRHKKKSEILFVAIV